MSPASNHYGRLEYRAGRALEKGCPEGEIIIEYSERKINFFHSLYKNTIINRSCSWAGGYYSSPYYYLLF